MKKGGALCRKDGQLCISNCNPTIPCLEAENFEYSAARCIVYWVMSICF